MVQHGVGYTAFVHIGRAVFQRECAAHGVLEVFESHAVESFGQAYESRAFADAVRAVVVDNQLVVDVEFAPVV